MIIYRLESQGRRHLQDYTKVTTRKLGEQNGLDTRVVQAVNYVYGYSYFLRKAQTHFLYPIL